MGKDRGYSPSFSLTVAYLEFANGQLCLLQKPVTLYSFRQKFCVAVLVVNSGYESSRVRREDGLT